MSIPRTTADLSTTSTNLKALIDGHLEDTGGLLRLSPTWVPRSFLQPGLRIKLHPDDTYAYGLNRGGIDERWFGSTTETANEGRAADEGLSYVVVGNERFTLRDAIAESGAQQGVTFKNTSLTEPLVALRYFGPEVNPNAQAMGAYKNQ